MQYEDEVRRLTLISGFVLGALVGTGIGLIVLPGGTRTTTKKIRRKAAHVERRARRRVRRAREGVPSPAGLSERSLGRMKANARRG